MSDLFRRRSTGELAHLLALLLTLAAMPAAAHELAFTDVLLILKTNGTYQVDITCELDALALGAPPEIGPATLTATLKAMPPDELERRVARLRSLFERRVRLRFDGEPARPTVTFPDRGTPLAEALEPPAVLGLTARLSGRVPAGAAEVTFAASRSFPPVQLTVLDQQTLTGRRQLLEQGAESAPHRLGEAPAEPGRWGVAGRYLVLGFWHIVPEGLDHILFVLGLFLLSTRWRPLLWQVSAFTVAHTATLALASYGVVRLSPAVVEPLIAASIAYVAVENLLTREMKPWRLLLVFAFGLLHGLGFAGVLAELGLPRGELATALVAFNAGVELGQLTVILAAFLVLGGFRRRAGYRRWVVVPLSAAIALVGLWWAVERTFLG